MKIFTKIAIGIAFLLTVSYIVLAGLFSNRRAERAICHQFEIKGADSTSEQFLRVYDFVKEIEEAELMPLGKPLGALQPTEIENIIKQHPFVHTAQCYVTDQGVVQVELQVKKPILRVAIPQQNYYLTDDTVCIHVAKIPSYTAHLPLATGSVTMDFAKSKLYSLAQYIDKHSFWNAQIEQIHVLTNQEVILIPRVGNQKIELGPIDDFEKKLHNLFTYYQNGQNKEIGWNRYSLISIKYNNQIVCTK